MPAARHEEERTRLPEDVHPYVAISREAGAGGAELARRVSADLGWELLDRELLHFVAERFHLPEWMLSFVDEKSMHWLNDVLGNWVSQHVVTQTAYVHRLGQTLLLAARHASAVVVGRGAQFFLPREKGLRVRVVAPRERRIERVRYVFGHDRDRPSSTSRRPTAAAASSCSGISVATWPTRTSTTWCSHGDVRLHGGCRPDRGRSTVPIRHGFRSRDDHCEMIGRRANR